MNVNMIIRIFHIGSTYNIIIIIIEIETAFVASVTNKISNNKQNKKC